jgi:hypothetical protein
MTIQQQEQQQPSRDALKVQAITQRIAEIVAQYEEKSADLRAEATITIGQYQQQIQSLTEELALANARIEYLETTETTVEPFVEEPHVEAPAKKK